MKERFLSRRDFLKFMAVTPVVLELHQFPEYESCTSTPQLVVENEWVDLFTKNPEQMGEPPSQIFNATGKFIKEVGYAKGTGTVISERDSRLIQNNVLDHGHPPFIDKKKVILPSSLFDLRVAQIYNALEIRAVSFDPETGKRMVSSIRRKPDFIYWPWVIDEENIFNFYAEMKKRVEKLPEKSQRGFANQMTNEKLSLLAKASGEFDYYWGPLSVC